MKMKIIFEKNNKFWFYEKKSKYNKVRDFCPLGGKKRSPVHERCNTHVKQKQNTFVHFAIDIFSNYDFHQSFRKIIVLKKHSVELDVVPETNEENKSISIVVYNL